MSHTISVKEFKDRMEEIISSLHPGDEVTLVSADRPVARLIPPPASTKRPQRRAGAGKGGLIILKEDDEHLEAFRDYME